MESTEKKELNMDLVAVLETCRDIEAACAELYSFFADRFAYDPELHQLWIKTFTEEENHGRVFALALTMRRENVVAGLIMDRARADHVLGRMKEFYDGVLAHPPSENEALLLAIKLEEVLSSFHLEAVAQFADEAMRKMFHMMMEADNVHLKRIKEMYAKRAPLTSPGVL